MQDNQESRLSCFKAYDVRGRVPDELNEELAFKIGQAFVSFLNARRVVVGYDIRLSSKELVSALSQGLITGGAEVLDIGLCGTEEVYFATGALDADGVFLIAFKKLEFTTIARDLGRINQFRRIHCFIAIY